MTPLAAFLWLAELTLEAAGAVYCFKVSCNGTVEGHGGGYRKPKGESTAVGVNPSGPSSPPIAGIHLLGAYLAFRAIADLICMGIMRFAPQCYDWADYRQRVIQYVIFGLLCVRVAAIALRAEKEAYRFYAGAMFVSWALGVIYFHRVIPMTMPKLCSLESCAHILAAAFLCVALRYGAPSKLWRDVSHGLLILASWDAILAAIQHYRIDVSGLYPLGAIAGLILLLWAVSRNEPEPVPEPFRMPLGVRTVSR